MGSWQIRAFATAAVMAAVIPIVADMVATYHVHTIRSGIHFRADLPGGFVIESRLETADRHEPVNQCAPGGGVNP